MLVFVGVVFFVARPTVAAFAADDVVERVVVFVRVRELAAVISRVPESVRLVKQSHHDTRNSIFDQTEACHARIEPL